MSLSKNIFSSALHVIKVSSLIIVNITKQTSIFIGFKLDSKLSFKYLSALFATTKCNTLRLFINVESKLAAYVV